MALDALAGRVFAAVLLDLDGTLIDSTAAVQRSWKRWAAEFGIRLPGSGEWVWHGIPAAQVVPLLLPPDQVARGVDRIAEIEIADTEGIVVLPGAEAALVALSPGRAAIVTSCIRPLADARIAASAITAPGAVVTADEVSKGKPDPEPYRLGARLLGVDPAGCLVVEDASAGLAAATAAGCATLALTTTTSAEELVADAVVPDLSAVRFVTDGRGVRVVPA
jgi:sugar-phosphatase